MPKRYFRLTEDVYVPGRWHLRTPTDAQGRELDAPWMFTQGAPIPPPGRLRAPIAHSGKPLDFSLTGLEVPIVHARVATLLQELAPEDVQLVPVEVAGHPDEFFILVATRTIRCIDDAACNEVELWTEEEGGPEKVGQYRDVYGLRIDPSKVGDAKVFRTWGWWEALIVSEDVKDALDRLGATGVEFQEV